ncbi:MAG TPA: glycosyl hydrolase family 8 [Polyangiaceae bacterium]|nr:glycosyl hydrolase family 8 [Polyangiaceae bacterium]
MIRAVNLGLLFALVAGCSSSGGNGSGSGGAGSNPTAGRGGNAATAGTAGTGASGGKAPTAGAGPSAGSGGTEPNPSPEACVTPNEYRNLLVELLGKTQAEVDAKLSAGFQSLFHGGAQETIYYQSGTDEAYILDVNNQDVRSEGMSYGMMVAVQLDKQAEFDRLWQWAKSHTQQSNGYFAWQTSASGQVMSTAAAPDGEEYFATALLFASHRWTTGKHDYAGDALKLLDALRRNGAFNESPPVVKFLTSARYSDPSYVLPAFYQAWACFDEKNRAFWLQAVESGRSLLQNAAHDETGLAPYLSNFDGTPHSNGPNFNSDAWRVVGNVMMDHHFFGADPWQVTFADTYAKFFQKTWASSPNAYEFALSGNVLQSSNGRPRGLVAMNSLVAFAASKELAEPALQALWDLPLPTGQYRYYDGMLYLFALLHASGSYRLY